jgi:hypothetical protein
MPPIKTHVEVLESVPTVNLTDVVSAYESEGAKVRVSPQTDGQYRIEAIFLDQNGGSSVSQDVSSQTSRAK